jgi:hypothetical protein
MLAAAAACGAAAQAAAQRAEEGQQCGLLRDICANPFRPLPPIAPGVFGWNGGLVRKRAQAAKEHRDLPSGHLAADRKAALGDYLEGAGSEDALLLGHLRGGGVRVRGCWAVDAVLARQ